MALLIRYMWQVYFLDDVASQIRPGQAAGVKLMIAHALLCLYLPLGGKFSVKIILYRDRAVKKYGN